MLGTMLKGTVAVAVGAAMLASHEANAWSLREAIWDYLGSPPKAAPLPPARTEGQVQADHVYEERVRRAREVADSFGRDLDRAKCERGREESIPLAARRGISPEELPSCGQSSTSGAATTYKQSNQDQSSQLYRDQNGNLYTHNGFKFVPYNIKYVSR